MPERMNDARLQEILEGEKREERGLFGYARELLAEVQRLRTVEEESRKMRELLVDVMNEADGEAWVDFGHRIAKWLASHPAPEQREGGGT